MLQTPEDDPLLVPVEDLMKDPLITAFPKKQPPTESTGGSKLPLGNVWYEQ